MNYLSEPGPGAVPVVSVAGLCAGYGGKLVLRDVTFAAAAGEIVLLVGRNGAGKSTVLKAVMGLLPATEGEIVLHGRPLGRPDVRRNVDAGMNIVLQHSGFFPNLSVVENLGLGAFSLRLPAREKQRRIERVLAMFPRLGDRYRSAARVLSGGEQRMLSIGISLMTEPRLLLIDEPSAGLAPALVDQVMAQIAALRSDTGATILLVEQNVRAGLSIADTVLVVRLGQIAGRYAAAELREREAVWDLF
jgi:branched-chain amino acid transport system ATP-binding protein